MSTRSWLRDSHVWQTPQTATLDAVTVNVEACNKVAELIRSQTIPTDREESSLQGLSRSQIGNFYLFLVAICHQTSPRGKPSLEGSVAGHHLRGWDYLLGRFEAAARLNPRILAPDSWTRFDSAGILKLFRDKELGDRISDPSGRASLVRDIGRKMLQSGWQYADQLYEASRGSLATGNPNLLDLLAGFRAYDDPVSKKSFFFLALMRNAGLWKYSDPEKLGAPVDYHEVRGHLRLGTVQICDPDLRVKLTSGHEVTAEEDILIRQAVHRALMIVSQNSALNNPSQLHYLFWNVFRSCCAREQPHCVSCPSTCSLPDRYVPLAVLPSGGRKCPFSQVCESAGREGKLLEQSVDTDYY